MRFRDDKARPTRDTTGSESLNVSLPPTAASHRWDRRRRAQANQLRPPRTL